MVMASISFKNIRAEITGNLYPGPAATQGLLQGYYSHPMGAGLLSDDQQQISH